MWRTALGVVVGVLAGAVLTGVFESMGHAAFPPPEGVNLTDPAQLTTAMVRIPLGAKLSVLAAWFLGVLIGASVAILAAGRRRAAGWITATILFAFAAWTVVTIPHPPWMAASFIVAELVAAALADRAFSRKTA